MAKYNRKTIEKWPNQKLVIQSKNGKNKPEVSFAFNELEKFKDVNSIVELIEEKSK